MSPRIVVPRVSLQKVHDPNHKAKKGAPLPISVRRAVVLMNETSINYRQGKETPLRLLISDLEKALRSGVIRKSV